MYAQALMRGSVEVSYGRVMLLGLAAAGKTSLMHGLMNEPLPDRAESTILADSHYYWVKTDQNHQSCWVKTTTEDEIKEEARAAHSATKETYVNKYCDVILSKIILKEKILVHVAMYGFF